MRAQRLSAAQGLVEHEVGHLTTERSPGGLVDGGVLASVDALSEASSAAAWKLGKTARDGTEAGGVGIHGEVDLRTEEPAEHGRGRLIHGGVRSGVQVLMEHQFDRRVGLRVVL